MKLPDTNTITGSIMAQVVISTIRGILNRSLKETTPKLLVLAIQENTSLWNEVNPTIMDYVGELPPFVSTGIKEAREIIDHQYGGVTHIVMQWLESDNTIYYNIIKNSDGGEAWVTRQINEILDGVQNNTKKER
jgi:hypothetical protein